MTTKIESPSPLHLAAYRGNPAAIEPLVLYAGLMVTDPDMFGYTPLHRAIQSGSLETVKVLIEFGADPAELVSAKEPNALILATQVGATNIVKWLLADVVISTKISDSDKSSALITAMSYRQYDIAVILLKADVGDSETKRTVTKMYEQQAGHAASIGILKVRHLELEAMMKVKEIGLSLPDFEKPKKKPCTENRSLFSKGVSTNIPFRRTNLPYLPGAMSFFPEFTPPAPEQIWHDIKDSELTEFLEQISPVDGKWKLEAQNTSVHWRHLPWYDTAALIHLRNPELDAQRVRLFYLTDRGNLFRLNGTSPPIHEVNAKAPIKLSEDNVLDYLRFFGLFVRGEDGPFYIAEEASDPLLPQYLDETAKHILSGIVCPASFEGMNDQGHYLCDAVISYSNALFIAHFSVYPTGMVEMLGDEPIAADLPGKVSLRLS